MAVFVLMQIILIVTFHLICMSDAENFSAVTNAEFVQGVIAIKQQAEYVYNVIKRPSEYVLQNIGRANVTVKKNIAIGRDLLAVGQTIQLNFTSGSSLLTSTNFIIFNTDLTKRAIVYITNFNKDYTEEPEQDYDRIIVLQQAFSLGVRDIPEGCKTLDTLISYFWPAGKDNVWKQIFNVIKVLLTPGEQLETSKWIESDIKCLKENLDKLNDKTNGTTVHWPELSDDINSVLGLQNIVYPRFTFNTTMLHFYILPLFTNLITLKLYFCELGTGNPEKFDLPDSKLTELRYFAWDMLSNSPSGAVHYLSRMQLAVIDRLYDTVYAPGLYNIMMCARSHLALHGMDLIPIWTQIYARMTDSNSSYTINTQRLQAISYSKYYGRATPNLLQQAIDIENSSLSAHYKYNFLEAAELKSISFNISEGTVCGLQLKFVRRMYTELFSTMGIFETANNKNVSTLDLSNRNILQLKVYKTKFIRCLIFTLSDRNTSIYGDCLDNSEGDEEFELVDHYINSLYLANDNTDTDTHFDNVAVSYLPNPSKNSKL